MPSSSLTGDENYYAQGRWYEEGHMATKSALSAFEIEWGVTKARIVLLQKVLDKLSVDEQIALIEEIFFETWGKTAEEPILLLDALGRLMKHDPMRLRTKLRSLYARCAEAYFLQGYYRPEVQSRIMREVLVGWNWRWSQPTGFFEDKTPKLLMSPDAKECFQFFVDAFLQASNKEIEDAFLKCLREHIDSYSSWGWNPEDLDQWILAPTLPQEVLKVLLNGRIRIGGAHMVRAELEFLEPFDLHSRSKEATSLIRQLMEQIRRTDELAQMIVKDIRPIDDITGLRNPETPLSHRDRAKWVLEAPGTARVIITFADGPNPAALRAVEDVRDAMILGMGDHTINIMISAS